jgi:ComF family protein
MIVKFLRILFPESCPVCKNPSREHKIAPICQECWDEISPYNGTICQICGKPLISSASIICGDCISDRPAFKLARSFGLYEATLKDAINLLKYYGIKRLSKPLSDIMLTIKIPGVDTILPVPLHKRRLRGRGFNQSALLAKHVAKQLRIPIIPDCLIKVRDTLPQVGLGAKEREKNIRKSFEVKNKELVHGKTIMLVDDVFTTGATVRECSKVLKKAGARDIYVITLAHSRGD